MSDRSVQAYPRSPVSFLDSRFDLILLCTIRTAKIAMSNGITEVPFGNSGTTEADTATGKLNAAEPLVPVFEAGEATMLMAAV